MEGLKDIKGLVEIGDVSWLWMLFLALILIGILTWIGWKLKSKKKPLSPREKAMMILQTVNIADAKACAYALSRFGTLVVDDANKAAFETLQERLGNYKYRAYDAPLSEEEKALWQQFLGNEDANV
ncbi:hypothetical protein [Sulfurospirillum oryzae]|uniref:hypothetical protein n=1 Tax=Sulfurospirillum oryzae TaxID=2976535 RepID=UPI0021E7BF9A|nr:hypothetical protein [Sulfurospirillum oryzae]